MRIQDARQEIQTILSFFSESFSRPSFKLFCSFVISFIQLGKEIHTSSMVQSLVHSFLRRSLSSFTRFLGESVWTVEEVAETALHQFFQTLQITARDVLFLIVDDSLVKKTGKKIPGCGWPSGDIPPGNLSGETARGPGKLRNDYANRALESLFPLLIEERLTWSVRAVLLGGGGYYGHFLPASERPNKRIVFPI